MSDGIKVIAVADDVGYKDKDGNVQYATRGDEITIHKSEWDRLGEPKDDQMAVGNFPVVVKPDHPHLATLRAGASTADDPNAAAAKLKAAHGGGPAPLLDPAGDPVDVPSETRAPLRAAATGLAIDFSKLNKDQLKALSEAAGMETSGKSKDDLRAQLESVSAGAGVTPRVGATPESAEPETPADGS